MESNVNDWRPNIDIRIDIGMDRGNQVGEHQVTEYTYYTSIYIV